MVDLEPKDRLIALLKQYKEFIAILGFGVGGVIVAFQFFVTQSEFQEQMLEAQREHIKQMESLQCLLIANVDILNGDIWEAKAQVELEKLKKMRKAISTATAPDGNILKNFDDSEKELEQQLAKMKEGKLKAREALQKGQCAGIINASS